MSKDDIVRLERRIQDLENDLKSSVDEKELLKIELGDCKSSLEKYRLISDFAHDWEMWFNPDGTIEYVSPSMQDITGYAPAELITNPSILDSIIYPEDKQAFSSFIDESIDFLKIKQSMRFRILTLTKQLRWCEIKCRAVYNRRGRYQGQRASITDITNLMQALGQIKDLSEGKQYEKMARQKYMRELESKEQELVSFLVDISQKNETIQYARRRLQKLVENKSDNDTGILDDVISHLQSSINSAGAWDNFNLYFEKINPGFLARLKDKFPALTNKDLKLCGYVRLGLSTKEIAFLQNITFESAEISRVRLRKKLGMTRQIKLSEFINDI